MLGRFFSIFTQRKEEGKEEEGKEEGKGEEEEHQPKKRAIGDQYRGIDDKLQLYDILDSIADGKPDIQQILGNFFVDSKTDPLVMIDVTNIYNLEDVSNKVAKFISEYNNRLKQGLVKPDAMIEDQSPDLSKSVGHVYVSAHGVYDLENKYRTAIANEVLKTWSKTNSEGGKADYINSAAFMADIRMQEWKNHPTQQGLNQITETGRESILGAITIEVQAERTARENKFKKRYKALFLDADPNDLQISANEQLENPAFESESYKIKNRWTNHFIAATGRKPTDDDIDMFTVQLQNTLHVRQIKNMCGVFDGGEHITKTFDITDISKLATRQQEMIIIDTIRNNLVNERVPYTAINTHLEIFFIRRILRQIFSMARAIDIKTRPTREWFTGLKEQASTAFGSYTPTMNDQANRYTFKPNDGEHVNYFPEYGLHILIGNKLDDPGKSNLMNKATNTEYNAILAAVDGGNDASPEIKMARMALAKLLAMNTLDAVEVFTIQNALLEHKHVQGLFDMSCQHSEGEHSTIIRSGLHVEKPSHAAKNFPLPDSQFLGGGKRRIKKRRTKKRRNTTKKCKRCKTRRKLTEQPK